MSTVSENMPIRRSARIANIRGRGSSRGRVNRQVTSQTASLVNRRAKVRSRRQEGNHGLPQSVRDTQAELEKARKEALASIKRVEALASQLRKSVESSTVPESTQPARGGRRPARGRRMPRKSSRVVPQRRVSRKRTQNVEKTTEQLNAELAAHMQI
ncbi:hypothetical protein P9112_002126 [Eukaryota sp. TZLM1-RC]